MDIEGGTKSLAEQLENKLTRTKEISNQGETCAQGIVNNYMVKCIFYKGVNYACAKVQVIIIVYCYWK